MREKTLCEKCKHYWTNTYSISGEDYQMAFCDEMKGLQPMSEIDTNGLVKTTVKRCGRFSEIKEK